MTSLLQSSEASLTHLTHLCQLINDALIKHQHPAVSSLQSLLLNIYDTAEDRLIVLFNQEASRCQIHFERLSLDEFAQFVRLIESFVSHVHRQQPTHHSRPMKTFLQSQTSRFLSHFHDERKQRVATTLDNEQWKQVNIVSSSFNACTFSPLGCLSRLGFCSSFDPEFRRRVVSSESFDQLDEFGDIAHRQRPVRSFEQRSSSLHAGARLLLVCSDVESFVDQRSGTSSH